MSLIGHWVARDAGGTGTTLPNRIDTADNGTLTAGCVWGTLAGESYLRCPGTDYAEVPDRAKWTLSDYSLIARLAFFSTAGVPGWLSHSEGGGAVNKWVWEYGHTVGGQGVHVGPANITQNGSLFALASQPTIYALGVTHTGSSQAINFWKDGVANDTGGLTLGNFTNAAATLKIGYGGEAFFDADVAIMTMRIYDSVLNGAAVAAAMVQDALDAAGLSSGKPAAYYAQQMGA